MCLLYLGVREVDLVIDAGQVGPSNLHPVTFLALACKLGHQFALRNRRVAGLIGRLHLFLPVCQAARGTRVFVMRGGGRAR